MLSVINLNLDEKKNCINFWSYRSRWFLFIFFFNKKGYLVHGVKRRSSSLNTSRIDHIYQDPI